MALINYGKKVIREIIDKTFRGRAGGTSGKRARIVLDSIAVAKFAHHFDIIFSALAKTLRFEEFVVRLEIGETIREFRFDASEGGAKFILAHDELPGGSNDGDRDRRTEMSSDRVKIANRVDIITKILDTDCACFVGWEDIKSITADSKHSRGEIKIVTCILRFDETFGETRARERFRGVDAHSEVSIFLAFAESVDAADGRDDNNIAPADEGIRGREAVALDFFVNRGVFFDVSIGLGDVCLRLVVVVVGDKILHGIIREKSLKLSKKLCGESLIVREDKNGT